MYHCILYLLYKKKKNQFFSFVSLSLIFFFFSVLNINDSVYCPHGKIHLAAMTAFITNYTQRQITELGGGGMEEEEGKQQ